MTFSENEEVVYSMTISASKTKFVKAVFKGYSTPNNSPPIIVSRVKRDEYGKKVGDIRALKSKPNKATIEFTFNGKTQSKCVFLDSLQKMTKVFKAALDNELVQTTDITMPTGFRGYEKAKQPTTQTVRQLVRYESGKIWEEATSTRWTFKQLADQPEGSYLIRDCKTKQDITKQCMPAILMKKGTLFLDSDDTVSQTKYELEKLDNFWLEG